MHVRKWKKDGYINFKRYINVDALLRDEQPRPDPSQDLFNI